MLIDRPRTRLGTRELIQYTRNGLTVARGPAAEFPPEALQLIARKTHQAYLQSGLFPGLPKEDEGSVVDVLACGMEERLVVSVSRADEIIGGCMVALGRHENTLSELSGKPESTLPTLWALSVPFCPKQRIGKIPENQAICFTRFWRDPQIQDGETRRLFAMETLSSMALVTQEYGPETSLAVGLLDTHDPRVAKTLLRFYGGQFIAHRGESRPTPQVERTVLKWHYETLASVIAVLGFQYGDLVHRAQQIDHLLTIYEGHNGRHP